MREEGNMLEYAKSRSTAKKEKLALRGKRGETPERGEHGGGGKNRVIREIPLGKHGKSKIKKWGKRVIPLQITYLEKKGRGEEEKGSQHCSVPA